MLEIDIPGWRNLQLEHLLLDINGTLALDGELLPGVSERVAALKSVLSVQLLSADTFGRLDAIARELGVAAQRLDPGESEPLQKARIVRGRGADHVVAFGNGANDQDMLREAALGIAVLGPEGLATATLAAADIYVASIGDALDLLLKPKRLVASLRR